MKIKNYYLSFGVISILFLVITASKSFPKLIGDAKSNKEIIKFSHRVHETVDCENCHSEVFRATDLAFRLLPVKENCASCHDVNNTEECSTCHYENIQEPLIQKKSELIFNHKYHIEEQGKKCIDCHKGISEVDYSFESALAKPKMELCYTCHNDKKNVTNACEACHTTTANLIPPDHQKTDYIKFHKFMTSKPNANCV
ncbi:MAG: cytochrome c3 family protein, partial [Ignavibacteria bacterium]